MNTPPLHERLNRLVSFAHPRNQPSLTNREISKDQHSIANQPQRNRDHWTANPGRDSGCGLLN